MARPLLLLCLLSKIFPLLSLQNHFNTQLKSQALALFSSSHCYLHSLTSKAKSASLREAKEETGRDETAPSMQRKGPTGNHQVLPLSPHT